MNVTDYKKQIAEMILDSMHVYLEQERKLKSGELRRGGGGGGPPMPILGVQQPSFGVLGTVPARRGRKKRVSVEEAPPAARQIGGKFNFAKAIKKVGQTFVPGEGQAIIDVGTHMATHGVSGAGIKPRAKRGPSARNMLVKQVMAERGGSLAQASKYIKDNNLIEKMKAGKKYKGGSALGNIIAKTAKQVGTKLGQPLGKTTGVNPFSLGFQLGTDVISPAIDKARGVYQ